MWNVDVVAGELGPGPITASAVEAGGVMVIEPLVNPKDMKEAVFLVVVFSHVTIIVGFVDKLLIDIIETSYFEVIDITSCTYSYIIRMILQHVSKYI